MSVLDLDPGNRRNFDSIKSRVIQKITAKPKTVDQLSDELHVTAGFASAVLFHIQNHERFEFAVEGNGRERQYSIL